MTDHTIKDTGSRRTFETGAQRDRGDLKPRPDLIHPYFLQRFGLHMARGAIKYSEWNWFKGMPLSDWYASLFRHVLSTIMGLEDEDHLSAIAFNVMGAMITKEGVKCNLFPKEFIDMPDFVKMHTMYLNLMNPDTAAKTPDKENPIASSELSETKLSVKQENHNFIFRDLINDSQRNSNGLTPKKD